MTTEADQVGASTADTVTGATPVPASDAVRGGEPGGSRAVEPGLLAAVGVGRAEEAAYTLLVDRPQATVAELAARWNHPEDLDEVLGALGARGMITTAGDTPPRYAAVAPEVAVGMLLLAGEQQLRVAREHTDRLATAYRRNPGNHEPTPVEVIHGRAAVLQRLTQMRGPAIRELRCFDRPPYVEEEGDLAEEELLGRGVACRTLYEHDALAEPGALSVIEHLVRLGEQARVLPSLPMKLYLVDDRLALLPRRREMDNLEEAVVVYPSPLLDALGRLFEALWARGLPLPLRSADAALGVRSTQPKLAGDDRNSLVALLLSGLTDEAISRQLGVSYRTVERRVATLMEGLGARTRFQAGVQAALRAASRQPTPTDPADADGPVDRSGTQPPGPHRFG